MNSVIRSATSTVRFVAFTGMLAASALANANTTHSAFVDVVGSDASYGFNNLTASRINGAQLAAGIANNLGDTGATLKRTSGTAYPASTGLYEWGGPRSTFEITFDAVADLSSITLQSLVNVSIGANNVWGLLSAANLPKLSFNGGNQLLSAATQTSTSVAFTDMTGTPTVADPLNPNYTVFNWDLSGVTTPITSVRLSFATDAHSQGLAFQVDQLAVAAVPEPSTYAMMFGGLGLMGVLLQRRRRQG